MTRRLSLAQARRVALAAQGFTGQGFTGQRAGVAPNWAMLHRAIKRLQLLQIDSVNVLTRAHYLPLFSRLGAYDTALLDARTLAPQGRALFECWAHEASFVPLSMHPLMRWRMDRARAGNSRYKSMRDFASREADFLARILDFVADNGPTATADLPEGAKSHGGWWGWGRGKMALEVLFEQGRLTTAARPGFTRLYDLPERVIPPDILALPTPPEGAVFAELTHRAAIALGIGTAVDLRDYFRLPPAEARTALETLVADGRLEPVKVAGWSAPAYRPAGAKTPRQAGGDALLSPFDPVVWNRDRAERLFNFHYRIEIYTPAAKRRFGYYVLPFLMGDELAGRVCLKADRQAGLLRANALHHEDGFVPAEVATRMLVQLHAMAGWMGLNGVELGAAGNLAAAARKAS
ncbi:MAG: crosslink repair DNA glycosylase YcaQ family protein [Paracoccaceae bacterium]